MADFFGAGRINDPYGEKALPIDTNSEYYKYTMPLVALLEAIGSKGKGTATLDSLKQMATGKQDAVSMREKALERKIKGESYDREKSFREGVSKDPSKIKDLYTQYDPIKAGEQALKADDPSSLSESDKAARDWKLLQSGSMEATDFFVTHPNALTSWMTTDPEGLKALLLREKSKTTAREEGKLDPSITDKKINQINTIEEDTRDPKVITKEKEAAAAAAGAETGARKAGRTLPIVEIDAVTGTQSAIGSLQEMLSTFNKDWAKPFVGQPISSFLSKFDKERAGFETTKQRFENELLKARSGAAVTPSEYTRLLKETGDLSVTPEVYINRLQNNTDYLNRALAQKQKNLKAAGYDVTGISQSIEKSGLKSGDVVDGYRYKGGDPSKQSSWEKSK